MCIGCVCQTSVGSGQATFLVKCQCVACWDSPSISVLFIYPSSHYDTTLSIPTSLHHFSLFLLHLLPPPPSSFPVFVPDTRGEKKTNLIHSVPLVLLVAFTLVTPLSDGEVLAYSLFVFLGGGIGIVHVNVSKGHTVRRSAVQSSSS